MQVRKSPEYVGAVAECEQAQLLISQLPEAFHVFHDVNVETNDWVWDGHEHRRSAQIDHVVVCAGGVFVIETKLWSRSFVAEGRYHDPYKQVRWAGKLLHLVLTDECSQKIRVREVISTIGSMPPKPSDSYAKVLRPGEVSGYVRWFPAELDERLVHRVATTISRWC